MDNQAAFSAMVQHARAQHCKSELPQDDGRGKPFCAYRPGDGKKCFVGALIPDALYRPTFEGATIGMILNDEAIDALFQETNHCMLGDMQAAHDNYPVDQWEEQFVRIAHRYKLLLTRAEHPKEAL